MATTTTNFGWDIPQSTDLVKDGATAIAALGQDIDTALVDLKGGTTGQVLAKASGTDLDFSWVAQDDSNAIQNAIVDAKGDLIAATGADTPARLAVGTNGQVLKADSTTATGLAWGAAGGDAWTKITSSSFTTQSAVSINSCFTSTYANYRVLINFTSSAGNQLYMRLRASGSDNTANSYTGGWQYQFMSNGGGTGSVGGLATYFYLHDTVSGNIGHVDSIDIFNPQAADRTKFVNNSAWTNYFSNGAGYFDNTTSFDGLTIYPTSGTITGTITVYGYGA